MNVLDFLTELQNAEVSAALLVSDSITDAFPAMENFIFGAVGSQKLCIVELKCYRKGKNSQRFFFEFLKF